MLFYYICHTIYIICRLMSLISWMKDVQFNNKIKSIFRPSLMKEFLKQILLCWAPKLQVVENCGSPVYNFEIQTFPNLKSRIDQCYLDRAPWHSLSVSFTDTVLGSSLDFSFSSTALWKLHCKADCITSTRGIVLFSQTFAGNFPRW